MTITRLVKVTLAGHRDAMEEHLVGLQALGCLHLIPLEASGTPSEEKGASREAKQALQFLASAPQKRRQVRDSSTFDAFAVEQQALELERLQFQLQNERDELEVRLEALAPWGAFEFPDLQDLAHHRMWFYAVPHHQMKEVPTDTLRWELVERDHRYCYLVVLAVKEPAPDAMPVPRTHVGSRSTRELAHRLEEVLMGLDDVEAERFGLTRWCTLLARAQDGLDDRAARTRAASQTALAAPVYGLQAWAPQDRLDELAAFAEANGLALEAREPGEDEQPPTRLENPARLRGGEDLVTFYMTPSYWVWDPSSVVFLSFAVFFAMILADTGYALVLGAILMAYWRQMGRSDTGRRWRVLLATLTVTTTLYGIVVGSYFGVTPPPGSFLGRLKLLDLGDFDTMMTLSVAVGVLHITYANVRDAARHRHWSKRLAPLGWAAIVIGGFVGWLGWGRSSGTLLDTGVGLASLGVLAVIGFAGVGERPLIRLVRGVSALTGISSAFGDVLSYLRLFALGLASASLAQAFNGMASGVREAVPGIGFFFGLVVLVIGHALNFTLSLSSGVIHGLRLNVIEFFNWGVKEEGKPYRPFERKETESWTTSS